MRSPAHAKINLYVRKFIRSNKYYKHCIVLAKTAFTIILIMKILTIFNKNLHNKNLYNNKLHNGQETRVHLLEILKFQYF